MPREPEPLPYTKKDWRLAFYLFASTFLAQALFSLVLPLGSYLYPASAVALAGLFFASTRFWPVVFLGLLAAHILSDVPLPAVYLIPAAQTVQAMVGAFLLRAATVDPLFRRYRDTFYTVTALFLASLITPSIFFLTSRTDFNWGHAYVATLFTLLVAVPFILRWLAKPRFRRPVGETLETLIVFLVLIGMDIAIFGFNITQIASIPLFYLLLIPFFWIAIRLRPRFVTLAILITSVFAVQDAFLSSTPESLGSALFGTELFLIVLSIVFYTVVSLEEDRRANTNLARTQLESLENALSRISSESQAKNDFIAILAHELRNPLAPVMSAIELMKIKGGRDEEEAETLTVMETSMQTVRRLLDDLLDISRISEGKVSLKREVIDLEQVVRRAATAADHYIKERHQTLDIKSPKNPLYVEGDRVRLGQVFSNLLTNAAKYTDSGGAITVSMAPKESMAEVEIRDTGIGIPPDAIATIFLPFHQLESGKRSKKGLGIGLALVHSFVEMHDGSVVAESEGEGKGTTFRVRLPLTDKKPAAQATENGPARSKKGGPRVLVVDDNDAAAAGIGRLLELMGATVTYAYDGGQAIDKARRWKPGVILLDIGLPGQDGYAVARILRTQGYSGPLIALSGFSTPDARERGKAAGFDDYLVKPASIAELRKVVPGLG